MEQQPPLTASNELAVSRAWQAGWFDAARLQTTDGQPLTVVYRGRWTFGFGPDFRGALIAFGNELRRGDIEIHLQEGGWRAHGHHLNPAYNAVILHVVLDREHLAQRCQRQDGVVVPTLVLRPFLSGPLEQLPADPLVSTLATMNGEQCVAAAKPLTAATLLGVLERAGDARLTAKAAAFEARFTVAAPGEILYAGVLEALGYRQNRAGMSTLAATLPLTAIEARLAGLSASAAFIAAAGLLLGVAGLLPFASGVAALGGLTPADQVAIEAAWAEHGGPWTAVVLGKDQWQLARVRPANHPVRRLLGAATLLAHCRAGGLLAAVLEPATAEEPTTTLAEWHELFFGAPRTVDPLGRYLGADRVAEIINNILVPFVLAYGAWAGNERLSSSAAATWEIAPAAADTAPTTALLNQLAVRLPRKLKTGRQQQGALHLFRHYCEQRRCFECPLARASGNAISPD